MKWIQSVDFKVTSRKNQETQISVGAVIQHKANQMDVCESLTQFCLVDQQF